MGAPGVLQGAQPGYKLKVWESFGDRLFEQETIVRAAFEARFDTGGANVSFLGARRERFGCPFDPLGVLFGALWLHFLG